MWARGEVGQLWRSWETGRRLSTGFKERLTVRDKHRNTTRCAQGTLWEWWETRSIRGGAERCLDAQRGTICDGREVVRGARARRQSGKLG